MSAEAVTIAWTAAEAILLGPESRLVRQPLAADDDMPALILEAWRTEFPEQLSAKLLAGDQPAVAAGLPGLIALAREAGLRLELAAPPSGDPRPHPRFWAVRGRLSSRWVLTGAAAACAILLAGWEWSRTLERIRVGRLTAEERAAELRQVETAAAGRRSQAATERAAALLAAVQTPGQIQGEWLAALAAQVPAGVVVDAVEISGARYRLRGHTVPGAPGAEAAAETLRRALFAPAARWRMENAESSGPKFAWEAGAAAEDNPPQETIPDFHDGRTRFESPRRDNAPHRAPPDHSSPPAGGRPWTIAADPRWPSPSLPVAPALAPATWDEAEAARDRLPSPAVIQSLLKDFAPEWKIEARGEADSRAGIERRAFVFSIARGDERAWPATLRLVRRLNTFPGVSIETLSLIAAPGENGSLKQAMLEITTRSFAKS